MKKQKIRYIFDLDRTIWETFDVTGRPIWAKQMLPPYNLEDKKVTDDVGSFCILKKGFLEFLKTLKKNEIDIGFISVGGIWETAFENQPSVKLLKLFEIYDFFGEHQYLTYKTSSKNPILEKLSPCVFFDDDPKHLVNAEKINGVNVIDSKKIIDWKNYKY